MKLVVGETRPAFEEPQSEKERTREDRKLAVAYSALCLHELRAAQDEVEKAKRKYFAALDDERAAVKANIEAWN